MFSILFSQKYLFSFSYLLKMLYKSTKNIKFVANVIPKNRYARTKKLKRININ